MKAKGEIYYEEFLMRFASLTNEEVVELYNKEIGNSGWGTARASYLAAIHYEFQRRKIDYFEVGNSTSLSLANKVIIKGNKLIITGDV